MPEVLLIALPTPLRRLFEYLPLPSTESRDYKIGARIEVPFGSRQLIGVLLETSATASSPMNKLRTITNIIDDKPIINQEVLDLCRWASNYYHHPLGETIQAALPVTLRKGKNVETLQPAVWVLTTEGKGLPKDALKRSPKQQALLQLLLEHGEVRREALRELDIKNATAKALEAKNLIKLTQPNPTVRSTQSAKLLQTVLATQPRVLNAEQQLAFDAIRYHQFGVFLLNGTTGSGKTEVYLHAIARVLQAGGQALVLVPEIGLAPQTLKRFKQRFRSNIVELHSNTGANQRTSNWLAAANGDADIVIGTRLATFTPMPKLGIIVIDEEHDLSFKQQDGLRYSARDLAIVRAQKLQIPLLLGSATPSLESLCNASLRRNKAYHYLQLTKRAGFATEPNTKVVDLRKETVSAGLAETTLNALRQTLDNGEQCLVFINRRGFAPALICPHCGWTANCNFCDAKLTLHNYPRSLRCHHCDRKHYIPKCCPSCQSKDLQALGHGTERCEEFLREQFCGTTILRVDQDSMQSKSAMTELYHKLEEGAPCILVGTQMLAKGHHFPKVTLAVILDIDQGLFSGDFRGVERMAQQIVQVSGRAGRGKAQGEVLLQTYKPDHPLLKALLENGYTSLAKDLIHQRASTYLPPSTFMALLRAESKRPENAIALLQNALNEAKRIIPPSPNHQYLGPLPALMERRNDRHRYQFIITFSKRNQLQELLGKLIPKVEQCSESRKARWSIDVDPQDMS